MRLLIARIQALCARTLRLEPNGGFECSALALWRPSYPLTSVLIGVAVVFLVGGAIWKDRGPWGPTVAAWVQAFGSIGAIWAALRVALRQTAERDERDRAAARQRDLDAKMTASSLILAAKLRLEEVNKSINSGGGPSTSRCRLWKSSLGVEARSLARIDTAALMDSRLVSITNSVLVQLEHAVVCIDYAMANMVNPSTPESHRQWSDLKNRLARRLSNVDARVSEYVNITFTPVDANGAPIAVGLGENDDEDLEEL